MELLARLERILPTHVYSVQAVTRMVQKAMDYIDQTPNVETKLELIDTLRDVTAGKVGPCA